METNAQYRGWMAEQIAKSYLYETGLLDVYQNEQDSFDFICMMKTDTRNVFAVQVKGSRYSKSKILRTYKKMRERHINEKIPLLVLYINYIDKTGYFEFIQKGGFSGELLLLSTKNLKNAIKNLDFS